MRYELSDDEWATIRAMPRVDDRRVLTGIFWVLRSGAQRRGLEPDHGRHAHDAAVRMIDTSIVRVHQHGASISRNKRQSMGWSSGGLTSKIHAVVDGNGLPIRIALTGGEAHDNRLTAKLLSRL